MARVRGRTSTSTPRDAALSAGSAVGRSKRRAGYTGSLRRQGVEAGQGSRGEFAFKVGSREIGHLHGDYAAHFGFPKQVWRELFEQGRVKYHPVFPGRPGFGARRIETDHDVDDVIALMRLNYERVVARHGLPTVTARRP